MKYFSASTGGFYDDAIHGVRTIKMVDPEWMRPTVTVTLEPGEKIEVDGQVTENNTDETVTVDVPDMSLPEPLIEVPNAACKLPEDVAEVTDADYQALLEAQGTGKFIQADKNGFPVAVDPPAATLSQLIAFKIREINAKASDAASMLTTGYPDFEMQTWPAQQAEALAWNADNAVSTPRIDAMATYRGVPREAYLQKTVAKVLYYQKASDYLVGTRQKYVDQASAAKSKKDLDAIVPAFTLPAP